MARAQGPRGRNGKKRKESSTKMKGLARKEKKGSGERAFLADGIFLLSFRFFLFLFFSRIDPTLIDLLYDCLYDYHETPRGGTSGRRTRVDR